MKRPVVPRMFGRNALFRIYVKANGSIHKNRPYVLKLEFDGKIPFLQDQQTNI